MKKKKKYRKLKLLKKVKVNKMTMKFLIKKQKTLSID